MQFDHLGLVVKSVSNGRRVLSEILGIQDWTAEFCDEINGVVLQFGKDPSGLVYELLQPLTSASPVYSALSGGKAILNHVAYIADDLRLEAECLQNAGCAPTAPPKPAIAYGGRRIQFFVTPLRFIIELVEASGHRHVYSQSDTPAE